MDHICHTWRQTREVEHFAIRQHTMERGDTTAVQVEVARVAVRVAVVRVEEVKVVEAVAATVVVH